MRASGKDRSRRPGAVKERRGQCRRAPGTRRCLGKKRARTIPIRERESPAKRRAAPGKTAAPTGPEGLSDAPLPVPLCLRLQIDLSYRKEQSAEGSRSLPWNRHAEEGNPGRRSPSLFHILPAGPFPAPVRQPLPASPAPSGQFHDARSVQTRRGTKRLPPPQESRARGDVPARRSQILS